MIKIVLTFVLAHFVFAVSIKDNGLPSRLLERFQETQEYDSKLKMLTTRRSSWIFSNGIGSSMASPWYTIPPRRRGEGRVLGFGPLVFGFVHKNRFGTNSILVSSVHEVWNSFRTIVSLL